MAAETENNAWTWAALEPEPTEAERKLYETFCFEFLVDRNPTRAASRCGFQAGFAVEYGRTLLTKSYVQRRIAELERHSTDPKKEKEFDAINTRARLRAIINDEAQKASARVSAARELNAMHGLHAPTRVDLNAGAGGAILVPVMGLDDWERAAQASQGKLMEATRDDPKAA
jgi:hypothetical protein